MLHCVFLCSYINICSVWLVWQFWAQLLKKGNIFHVYKVIFPLLHSPFPHTQGPLHKHTHHQHPPVLLSLPLSHVIKASAWPRWPQATCLFIRGKRRESCHIPLLHGRATSLSTMCVRTLSHFVSFLAAHIVSLLFYLMRSRPPFSFPSPTLFIFTHSPFSARNKRRKSPWHYLPRLFISVLFLTVRLY